ncbi:MAG: multidrug transporter [Sphingomonas sp. 28-66-16]|nr:MAG: multidrug transporter [Sphingomonas sp. 28-66-16]
MRNSLVAFCALIAAALLPLPAAAQAPLTLDEVLQSSRRHVPQILEAVAKVRQAQGKALSAEGAFDTIVKGEAETRLSGYYDGSYAAGTITRPIENWGGSLYGGYRVSRGDFPIYEDDRFTNQLGEIKVGALLSLLRDRAIDDRRAGRLLARTDVDIAETERLLTAIAVQRRAIGAYNQWVVAGLRLSVYRDLLNLARQRQTGFERQVELGARPSIILTENEQNILRRETLVARAEQELATAANALSLFLRDARGAPMQPDPARLPNSLVAIPRPIGDPRAMLAARPDLAQIDLRLDQAATRLDLDRNALRPRLDLKLEASQDIGPIGLGGRSRVGTETKVGLSFSLPLQRRVAKGRIDATSAEIDALRRRRQQTEESIVNALDALAIDVQATERLRTLVEAEQDRAAKMAQAERRRFTMGASDFFLVNVREEAAADASVRQLDAAYRQIVARAELAAAAVDLKALGLE